MQEASCRGTSFMPNRMGAQLEVQAASNLR